MKRKNTKWTVQKIVEAAGKCRSRYEFMYRFHPAYKRARKLGILYDLFGPKHKPKPKHASRTRYWTLERLTKTAARYKTIMSFRFHQPGAYMAAYMHNCLPEICAHMPKRIPWVKKRPNKKLIFKAASETNSGKEFKLKYNGAYINAFRHGLLDQILKEMRQRREGKNG
jgi:hypothetical protein